MNKPLQTVVETPPYLAQAKGILSEDVRARIVEMIAADPTCGAVIEGSGGARKARFAVGNKGKSGGVRVVYAYHSGKFSAFTGCLRQEGAFCAVKGRDQCSREGDQGYLRRVWRKER